MRQVETQADRHSMMLDTCLINGTVYPCSLEREFVDDLEFSGHSYALIMEERNIKTASVAIDTVIARIFSAFDVPELGPFKVKVLRRETTGEYHLWLEEQ